MWKTDPADHPGTLVCPFCGLACDDLGADLGPGLGVDGQPVLANGCDLAQGALREALGRAAGTPRIAGATATLDAAIARAAELLGAARAPLFAGLATDASGMRAALALGARCGAILDHLEGDALFRNLLVLQDSGWEATTLAEVRNRADLIVLVGTQCLERFPRLPQRVLLPAHALFAPPGERRLVLLGPWESQSRLASLPQALRAAAPLVVPASLGDLAGVCGLLGGLLAGRPVRGGAIPGLPEGVLGRLADALRAARYAVFCWSAAELDFPHGELTVQAIVALARECNRTARCAVLPLGGTLGDLTVNQVCTWQTGYPLRSGRRHGRTDYQPQLYRHQGVLARGECDLLLWVQALPGGQPGGPDRPPPVADCPTIVLGYPGIAPARVPEVLIPVGLPGIDHPGHWFRSDAVVPLPLGQVRAGGPPGVARVLGEIARRLPGPDGAGPPC